MHNCRISNKNSINEIRNRIKRNANYFNNVRFYSDIINCTEDEFEKLCKELRNYYKFTPKENTEFLYEVFYHFIAAHYFQTHLGKQLFNSFIEIMKNENNQEHVRKLTLQDIYTKYKNIEDFNDGIQKLGFYLNEITKINNFIERTYGKNFYRLLELNINSLMEMKINEVLEYFLKYITVTYLLIESVDNSELCDIKFYVIMSARQIKWN